MSDECPQAAEDEKQGHVISTAVNSTTWALVTAERDGYSGRRNVMAIERWCTRG